MTILPLERRQLVSTSGLTILFGAALAAMSYGLVDAWGMTLACLPPILAGTAISLLKRWPAMALVTVGGGLAILAVSSGHGAGAPVLLGGLALLLLLAPLYRTRWLLPAALAPAGAYLLLGLWASMGLLHQGPTFALAIGVTWLTGAALLAWPSAKSSARSESSLAVGNAAAALLLLVMTQGLSAALCAVVGALSFGQGLLLQRLAGARRFGALALQLLGLLSASLAAYLVFDTLGLVASLALIALGVQRAAQRRGDALLDHIALAITLLQAAVLTLSHPALHSLGAIAWHLWSLTALALGAQILWLLRAPHPLQRKQWVGWMLPPLAALLALGALSSEVALLVPWVPALTLLWTLAGAGLWHLGQRLPSLRVAAGIASGAALIKLLVWDWPHLGPSARVLLLMLVGTTMLVTPLLSLPRLQQAEESR